MKDDLYFMSVAVLTVWKQADPNKYTAAILCDIDREDYLVKLLARNLKEKDMISEVFDDCKFENGYIYMTATPSTSFIEKAKEKLFDKITYIPTADYRPDNTYVQVIPFIYTFGRIIDVLSDYKPNVTFINTV
jgi:hypothetical protein